MEAIDSPAVLFLFLLCTSMWETAGVRGCRLIPVSFRFDVFVLFCFDDMCPRYTVDHAERHEYPCFLSLSSPQGL